MRSGFTHLMPPKLRRDLAKLGADIALARRKRRLTVIMMAERIGTGRLTYLRVEKGDPKVSMGVYAMALFILGFSAPLAEIADPRGDDTGLLLDAERQPKRVRAKKTPTAL
jgi:DNA-binding XRE family transcriptional regulator